VKQSHRPFVCLLEMMRVDNSHGNDGVGRTNDKLKKMCWRLDNCPIDHEVEMKPSELSRSINSCRVVLELVETVHHILDK